MEHRDQLDAWLLGGVHERRRGQRNAAIVLLVLATGIVLVPFGQLDIRIFIAVLSAAAGVGQLAMSLRRPQRHPVLRVLRDRPGDVVWLYLHHMRARGGVAESTVVLGLEDGSLVEVAVELGNDVALVAAIRALVPQATVGYDAANEAAFRKDPKLLRRRAAS